MDKSINSNDLNSNRNSSNSNSSNNNNNVNTETKTSSGNFGGYILLLTLIFFAFIIYMYSDTIGSLWNSINNITPSYPIIKNRISLKQDYNYQLTVGELTGNTQMTIIPDKGHAITIKCDLHILNTMSNEGWASSFQSLKPIIKIGESPHIYYNAKDSLLVVVVKYRDNPYYPHYNQTYINFPVQKLTSIVVNIVNSDIRIYMDGNLVKFTKLDNVAIISNNYNDVIKVGEYNNNIQGDINNLSISFHDSDGK
jgi:hypothetical protein